MKISVVMPCYNHKQFVRDAAESVLNQSLISLEFIIIDDCSTDGTKEVLKEYEKKDSRIKCIYHEKNTGFTSSINDGLAAATGDFIAIQNSDDIWHHNKLEEQIKIFEKYSEVDVVASDADIIDANGRSMKYSFLDIMKWKKFGLINNVYQELCDVDFCCHPSVIFRTSCLNTINKYDETLKSACDWWFLILLAKAGHNFYLTNSKLLSYRVHPTNLSRNNPIVYRDMMLIRKRLAEAGIMRDKNLAKAAFYASFLNDYPSARKFASAALAGGDLTLFEKIGLLSILKFNHSGAVLLKLNQLKHLSLNTIRKLESR